MAKKTVFLGLFTLSVVAIITLPLIFYLFVSGDYYGRTVSKPAPDFMLEDTSGKPHSLEQHRGKFVYLYFGYLRCDDICHNQVGVMFNLNNHTDNQDLDFIFITMDPQRDSKESLDDYINHLGRNFTALTGKNMMQIQKVARRYNAPFFADRATTGNQDYEIEHPGTLFLIDPKGMIRMAYQNKFLRYDKMIEDLNKLRETSSNIQ